MGNTGTPFRLVLGTFLEGQKVQLISQMDHLGRKTHYNGGRRSGKTKMMSQLAQFFYANNALEVKQAVKRGLPPAEIKTLHAFSRQCDWSWQPRPYTEVLEWYKTGVPEW